MKTMKTTQRLLGLLSLLLMLAVTTACEDLVGIGDDSDSDSDAVTSGGG